MFRQHIGSIKRLKHNQAEPFYRPLKAVPRQVELDEQRVLDELLSCHYDPAELETGEELNYFRPGLQYKQVRKLRRGQYRITAELDLHGMTIPVARQALIQFIDQCRKRDHRCVRIIHGKGNRSRNRGPVLKTMLNKWLQLRDEVLGFCSTRPYHGGTGAIYVLLRSK